MVTLYSLERSDPLRGQGGGFHGDEVRMVRVREIGGMRKTCRQSRRGGRCSHEVGRIELFSRSNDTHGNLNACYLGVDVRFGRRAILVNTGLNLGRASEYKTVAVRYQTIFAVVAQHVAIP